MHICTYEHMNASDLLFILVCSERNAEYQFPKKHTFPTFTPRMFVCGCLFPTYFCSIVSGDYWSQT